MGATGLQTSRQLKVANKTDVAVMLYAKMGNSLEQSGTILKYGVGLAPVREEGRPGTKHDIAFPPDNCSLPLESRIDSLATPNLKQHFLFAEWFQPFCGQGRRGHSVA
eukprot:4254939-Pyramimonas_sp.AAC.2